jgi:hypothetical protein
MNWIGVALILFGLASTIWGSRELSVGGGKIIRLFSWRTGSAKWIKWFVGIALIYAGASIILRGN